MIGSHDQKMFDKASVIIPSPGIPLNMPFIKSARNKGVPVKGELDIFTQYNTTPVIAITATNGKTTTTELTAAMLEASGISCFVGGNIGTPLVEYLMQDKPRDAVVAEISVLPAGSCPDLQAPYGGPSQHCRGSSGPIYRL